MFLLTETGAFLFNQLCRTSIISRSTLFSSPAEAIQQIHLLLIFVLESCLLTVNIYSCAKYILFYCILNIPTLRFVDNLNWVLERNNQYATRQNYMRLAWTSQLLMPTEHKYSARSLASKMKISHGCSELFLRE